MTILDAWSMILTFEVTVPSYCTKSEDRTKRYKCLVYSYPALDGERGIFPPPLLLTAKWTPQKLAQIFEQFYALPHIWYISILICGFLILS